MEALVVDLCNWCQSRLDCHEDPRLRSLLCAITFGHFISFDVGSVENR